MTIMQIDKIQFDSENFNIKDQLRDTSEIEGIKAERGST